MTTTADAADLRRVLVDWNDTAVDYPEDRCLHQLFEERARRSPDALAVAHRDERLTAGELDARANRLAHALIGRGVGPEVLVGLCLERGPDLVVATLAVLKAGGGYVPLDPRYPRDRLAHMLADTAAPVVLTRRDVSVALPESTATVFLDDLEDGPSDAPDVAVDPRNAAVVLYTSGSTGQPKGAVLTHRGLVRLVSSGGIAPYDDTKVASMIASPSFDASAFELWHALLGGACLAIYPAGVPTAEGLRALIARHGVTTMLFTTGLFHTVVDNDVEVLDGLEQIVVGGEVLSPAHCARAVARVPGLRITNVYGPTECSAVASCADYDPADGDAVLPIGRLTPNTRIYLLDDELRPVPVGAAGEAYIAGDGLGRAFRNKPGLTSERFVADPFGAPGARMYRTGDLLRWRADGVLEFVSRVDDQVKVRGFRIEPGEIENVLSAHPGVTRAVVAVREDQPGRKRLVGYVSGDGLDADEVAGYAARVLPEHMVPSAVVVVDSFPLNPNGKVDRRALPEPVWRPAIGEEAPRTPVEHVLARLWAEVLGVESVGVRDDFFADLDGDSLLAMRLAARVRAVFGDGMSARALFDNPTVAALAAVLPAVPLEASDGVIPVAPRDRAMPLSFSQQGIWFLQEMAPDSTDYNTAAGLRLTGDLDVGALRVALDRLVARHEPLRTTFETGDGRGAQVVHGTGEVPLDVITVADRDPEVVRRLLRDRAARPFDLRRGPVLRVTLLVLSATEHVLVLDQHHIVTDGWAVGVLVDELLEAYADVRAGEPERRPPLRVQHADFAAWERERQTSAAVDRDLAYWTRQLDGLVPLELPTDRRRPPVRSGAGSAHRFELPAPLVARLTALGAEHNATLFATLVAAVQVLFARHSGQDDVAIGTVTAGRDQPELERVLGFFVRTLVIRSHVDDDLPFTEFLDRTRETVLAAFAHQELPFERLVEALRPDRDTGGNPLVQYMVALQQPFVRPTDVAGLRVEEHHVPRVSVPFDLFVEFWPHEGGLTAVVNYSTALFDAATVEGLAARLRVLLTAIADDPTRPVGDLPVLTGVERRFLRAGGRDTDPVVPNTTVTGLFAAQVARRPSAVAVVDGEVSLTFRQLDRRANALAHRLVAAGVRPDQPVALLMARSADLVVAELAVLKAGAAYLPLDVAAPPARLRSIVADAAPDALLVDRSDVDLGFAGPVVVVEGDLDAEEPPAVPIHPDNLACVLYTSGSTGRPKGVALRHRGLAALVADDLYQTDGYQRSLLHSAVSFDGSAYELWVTVLNGGGVVVGPADGLDADAVRRLSREHGLTWLFLTEGLFRQFADQDPACFRDLRVLWIGGDAVSPASVRRVLAACPHLVVGDGYGPTEATCMFTGHRMTAGDWLPTVVVPIGLPLDDTRVYVLDDRLRLAPPGTPGELCFTGAGTARGYLRAPGLTAERFVANPFGEPGSVMYRTGDVVRWHGGVLEFLGRTDHQVKVRGFRIEPAEIEAALLRQPGITQAVVQVFRRTGSPALVAYLVGDQVDHDRVRAGLAEELPAYLVPNSFVTLDALPLTRNRKVDRAALPEPERRTGGQAPRTDVERTLADIWADLLGVPGVGVEDNFFKLGGDSIVGLQVVHRARQHGLDIASRDLFRWQTVGELAAHAVRVTGSAVEREPATGDAPLTPIQRWFFEAFRADPHHFTQTVRVELTEGAVDEHALRTALAALMEHHDVLRARFDRVDGSWRAHVLGVEAVDFPLTARDEPPTSVDREIAGLDLTVGPLVAAVVFTGGERPTLVLAAHHLVVDGVSWRILLEDLESAYRQALRGETPDLGRKTTSFREWATRLTAHADAGGFDDERAHWAALPPAVPVPVDGDGPNTPGSAHVVLVGLDRDETRTLLRDAPKAYRTQANDLLLTALARVLAGWTGDDRVVVDVEGHGREDVVDGVDLTRTVGWFTSLFPVALDASAEDVGTRIKAVKERLRAVPRRGVGFGVLRHLLGMDAGPRPEVGFNYLGDFEGGGPLFARPRLELSEGPDGERPHVLDVVGVVVDGCLEFHWAHSANRHREDTVRALAEAFTAELRALVGHCTSPDVGGRTPSDFPLAGLDQEAVDRIAGDGRSVEDVLPLTPMQSGMLFHSVVDDVAGLYVEQTTMVLAGIAEPELLGLAWQRVADRIPVLRTAIEWHDVPAPVQVVRAHADLPVTHLDWRTLDDTARRRELRDRERLDRAALADLTTPPLVRVTLARLDGTSVEMLWTFHHALLDGWSVAQVLDEVFGEYAALLGGAPFDPPTRPPYRDYVEWLRGQDVEAAERHWRGVLAGLTAPTPLPFDRRNTNGGAETAVQAVELSAELSGALDEVAKRAEVTVNTLVQGVWAVLLARFAGVHDVCFGATATARPAALDGVDAIIGLFLNTLPVRVHVDPSADLVAWLRDLQSAQADARAHEQVSLTQVQGWSELPPGAALFDSVVIFENYPFEPDSLLRHGVELVSAHSDSGTNYPLNLIALPGERLGLRLSYDATRFDRGTAARLVHGLQVLLDAVAENPDRPLRALDVLTDAERRQLLVERNDTAADFPADRCLPELIDERAALAPDAVAVTEGLVELTYADLVTRANRLAHHLVDRGVGPDLVVGVCLPRGIDLVVAELAVLKAGGAYVPLDPDAPPTRTAHVVGDTSAPVVLTTSEVDVPWPSSVAVVRLDEEREAVAAWPDTPPVTAVRPDNLAYVIYTSGSTGVPKGVMVEHRNLVQLCTWQVRDYGIGPDDRTCPLAALGFDASVWELWPYLLAGARVDVPGREVFDDATAMVDWFAERGTTICYLLPARVDVLMDEPGLARTRLRLVLTGGDTVRRRPAPGTAWRLVNHYGATEMTVVSTGGEVRQDEQGLPDVGVPLANATAYVLDGSLRPVPVGAAGEVYLGGVGLSRGYRGRPDLTAERFVAHPFGAPGDRIYRTGDIGRWNRDGRLEFIGRSDDQVKIRGFRVEPGEVEHALLGLPGVEKAVVSVSRDGDRAELVAHVVGTPGTDLGRALADLLPDYLVPSVFVPVDDIPLTAHGKVDRSALPPPAPRDRTAARHVDPRDPTETALARIWAEVLGVDRVGVHDDFFDLGGDSITSLKATSRIRRSFGVEMSPRDLFEATTIDGLAEVLRERILAQLVAGG